MSMTDETFHCTDCQQTDLYKLVYQPNDDTHICTVCGAVLADVSFAQYIEYLQVSARVDNAVVPVTSVPTSDLCNGDDAAEWVVLEEGCVPLAAPPPVVVRPYKGTYSRIVHFTERISAHCRRDPEIPEHHLNTIRQVHLQRKARDWFYRQLFKQGLVNKAEIQKLLRLVDKRQESKVERVYCKLYLERWESLIADLEGVKRPTFTDLQAAQVGELMIRFSVLWDSWQPPAVRDAEEKRQRWRYPHHKHFPNINYAFRQALNILNLHQFDSAFPVPRTSLPQLNRFWRHICQTLHIPFCQVTPHGSYRVRLQQTGHPEISTNVQAAVANQLENHWPSVVQLPRPSTPATEPPAIVYCGTLMTAECRKRKLQTKVTQYFSQCSK